MILFISKPNQEYGKKQTIRNEWKHESNEKTKVRKHDQS